MGTCKRSRKKSNRRAASPVTATVLIVAISVTVSVAVAFWMGGMAGTYTRVEQIEILNTLVSAHGNPNDWNVTLTVKNTGTGDSTLLSLFITVPYSFSNDWATNMTNTQVIHSGETLVIHVFLDHDRSTLSSGTFVNLNLHSADGMDFPIVVELI
jgi:hypothetical protein